MVSIITTCKGRLSHLKECLPTWLSQTQQPHEIIVVDYECPEKSGQWAESMGCKAVYATARSKYFNLSHARNEGIKAASGDILLIIDADTKLSETFLQYHLQKALKENTFLNGWGYGDATGTCMVRKADALSVRGYNEAVEGWGYDDIDFYLRLEKIGKTMLPFHNGIETIKHGDAERIKHYKNANMKRTDKLNKSIVTRKFESIL